MPAGLVKRETLWIRLPSLLKAVVGEIHIRWNLLERMKIFISIVIVLLEDLISSANTNFLFL